MPLKRICFIVLCSFPWTLLLGQDSNKTNARYLIDDQSNISISTLTSGSLNLSDLVPDRTQMVTNSNVGSNELPFFGKLQMNNQGAIISLDVKDELLKFGTKKAVLANPIRLEPSGADVQTAYHIVLTPEEMKASSLNQLPILPDSIRITLSISYSDSDLSDLQVERLGKSISASYFSRTYHIERTVFVKIAPFGWESINEIAPIIDWDNAFDIKHIYVLEENSTTPLAIINEVTGGHSIAFLEKDVKIDTKMSTSFGGPSITAIPNPVINDVRFEVTNLSAGNYAIRIKNILGELKAYKTFTFTSTDYIPIDIKDLRKGSYFYVLEDEAGNVISTKRLIVLRP